jgi:hypothetical protein
MVISMFFSFLELSQTIVTETTNVVQQLSTELDKANEVYVPNGFNPVYIYVAMFIMFLLAGILASPLSTKETIRGAGIVMFFLVMYNMTYFGALFWTGSDGRNLARFLSEWWIQGIMYTLALTSLLFFILRDAVHRIKINLVRERTQQKLTIVNANQHSID